MPPDSGPDSGPESGPETRPDTLAGSLLGGIVLAGGAGRRLGGMDKARLELAGRSLLDHAVSALRRAEVVVVVGSPAPTPRPVRFTREEPAGGGPVAGVLAGLRALGPAPDPVTGSGTGEVAGADPRWLALLAVDMPWVSAATFDRLVSAAGGRHGAFLHDPDGSRQLCGVLALPRLEARAAEIGTGHGTSVRRLLDGMDLARVDALVTAQGPESRDVDTWGDLRDGS